MDLRRADLAGWNRSLGSRFRIEAVIERIVEKHAADVEQRQGSNEQQQAAVHRCGARQRHAGEHIGPDRRQIGHAPEFQRDGQLHTVNDSLTQFSSRAMACSMPPARRCSGRTFQV